MELKEYILKEVTDLRRGTDKVLKELTQPEFAWRPSCGCNSIGLILYHVVRAEDSFINSMLQGKKEMFETGNWCIKMNKPAEDHGSRYTIDQVNEFQVPDIKDVIAYLEAIRANTLEYIKTLTPSQLDKKVKTPRGEEVTTAFIMAMVVAHASQHIGEMSYLRGLQRGLDK